MVRPKCDWLAMAALSLAGCASTCGEDVKTQATAVGELGNGDFIYVCGGPSDPMCEEDTMPTKFPECVVVGGQFDLEYELIDVLVLDPNERLTPLLYIESVNQKFFEGIDEFQAMRAGEAAFIVRENDQVLDLIHMRAVEAETMEIVGEGYSTATNTVEVAEGEMAELRVFPRSQACPQVGGAIPIEAESSEPEVVTVVKGQQLLLQLEGQGRGTATVRVRLGSLEQTITVAVSGALNPPLPETDGMDTDGSETDTDGSGSEGTGGATGGSTSGDTDGMTTTGGSSTGMGQ